MYRIGNRFLENGGWIIEDEVRRALVYRKGFGAKTYEIAFSISDDIYTLSNIVRVRVGEAPSGYLDFSKAQQLLEALTAELKSRGVNVSHT